MDYKQGKQQKSFIQNITEFIGVLLIVFFIRTVFFGLYQVPTGSMERTMLVGERFFADKLSYWIRKPARGEIIAINDPEYVYSTNPVVALFEQYVWGPSNWTKRIIGVPGDIVEGRIENGKPVVYVNKIKLDEPYLNPYPLIHVWKENPEYLRQQIDRELQSIMRGKSFIDQETLERVLMQKWSSKTTLRTFDPEKSYDQQPYYRIDETLVIKKENGTAELIWPGTPINPNQTLLATTTRSWSKSDVFYVELGSDEYWCMGDNRLASKDSRFLGPYKCKYIHARIPFCIWSLDSNEDWAIMDLIKHPIDIWSRIRWSRCLRLIS